MNNFQDEQPATMTFSTLEAMCRQESTTYKCEDYLHRRMQPPSSFIDNIFHPNKNSNLTKDDIETCMNNRSKMSQWCMTLMDACQLDRETVSIAMSNLDRFLATEHGAECMEDSTTFQLACMTALYSAIKVHEEKAISPETLSHISRGFYSKHDMEAMEWTMLQALQWRVNAPTPLAFCREFLNLIPDHVLNQHTKAHVLSLTKLQTELAVADYRFVTLKPSSIGFAALTNAMDVLGVDFSIVHRYILLREGSSSLVDTEEVMQIQTVLYTAVAALQPPQVPLVQQQQPETNKSSLVEEPAPKRRLSHTISPRTVIGQAA